MRPSDPSEGDAPRPAQVPPSSFAPSVSQELEPIDRRLRLAITDSADIDDMSDPALRKEPTDSKDRAEPIDPIDSTDPTDPMDSAEFFE
jgi:hypothetical protein